MLNNLCLILIKGSLETDINRIKVVLVEQRRTNKWLADTLGKDCTTVSKWCTNTAQPGLETLVKIAECLNVDARELLFLQRSNFKPIMKKL
ncbi:MAG: helix-turn-helix transcriptional regulator [Prevotella sp.]|nr:helix-turn-helix transcriptional regulator [bacterium]MDY4752269.1 helix-turn-helix transcriptional regulator [Prevotella sp.]